MSSFLTVPARTVMTAAFHGDNRGSLGIAVVEGELCLSIAEDGGSRVMVARLDHTALDEFCGLLADHLPSIARLQRETVKLGEAICASRH